MQAHAPFNLHFWAALAAIMLTGGLLYGQSVGLNDQLAANSETYSANMYFTSERVQLRHIDAELELIQFDDFEDDFSEVDEALGEF